MKNADSTPVQAPSRTLLGPTSTPVQALRTFAAEYEWGPMSPATTDAVWELLRLLVTLPKESVVRAKVKRALDNWLKEIQETRTFRIFVKQMKEADAHHARIFAEQEKKQRERQHARTIAKQRDANKRLRSVYVEGCNTRAGEERKRVRASIFGRECVEPGKRPIMEGKRAARRGKAAAGSTRRV